MHGASATVWTFAAVTAAKSKPRRGAGGGHTPWGSAGRGEVGGLRGKPAHGDGAAAVVLTYLHVLPK